LFGSLDESDGEDEGEGEGDGEGEGEGEGTGEDEEMEMEMMDEGIAGDPKPILAATAAAAAKAKAKAATRAARIAAASEGASEHIVPIDLRCEFLVRKIKYALSPKSSNLQVPWAKLVSRVVELAEQVTSNFKIELNVVHNSVHHTTPKTDLEIAKIANCLVDNEVFRNYELESSKPRANIENAAYQKIAGGYIAKVVAAVRPIPYTKVYRHFVSRSDPDVDSDDDDENYGGINLRLQSNDADHDLGLGLEEGGDEENEATMYLF